MSEWNISEFELPPCDGYYYVGDSGFSIIGICWYDGWGFLHEGHYVEPELWKKVPDRKKRYGKIK